MCRRTTIGMLAVSALAVSACGSNSEGATNPRPPAPVNLTVYINNSRVSLAPSSVGAGPVAFIISNQASQAESLAILPKGSAAGQPLANTGPINPQATAQVTVNLNTPGAYTVATAPNGSTEAAAALPTGVRPAVLRVGHQRPSGSNELLQP